MKLNDRHSGGNRLEMEMTDTYTPEARAKLEAYLAAHDLPEGLGNKESACSIAAINLSISGKLTDDIPDCMSEVLGIATIKLQDAMPHAMRNSARYKQLLPDMAGTGRDREKERLAILMDWMWSVVLPQLQDTADPHGFGSEWKEMCVQRSAEAARAAEAAYWASRAAFYVADAVHTAVRAATYAADAAAWAAARAASAAGLAAAYAATAYAAYAAGNKEEFWRAVDPIGVLERMTYLKGQTNE